MFGSRCAILTIRGELEGEPARAEAFLQTVLAADPELLIVDLTGVERVPRELVEVVLAAQRDMRRRDRQLLVEGLDLTAGSAASDLDEAFAAYRRTQFRAGRHQKAG